MGSWIWELLLHALLLMSWKKRKKEGCTGSYQKCEGMIAAPWSWQIWHSSCAPCVEESHQLLRNFHVVHGTSIPSPSMRVVLLASVSWQAAIIEWQNVGDIELSQNPYSVFCALSTFLYLSVPYCCWVFPFDRDRTTISARTKRRKKYLWAFLAFKQNRTCFMNIDL